MGFEASFSYHLPLKKGVKIEEVEEKFNKNQTLVRDFGDNISFDKEISFYDAGGRYSEGEFYGLYSFLAEFVTDEAYFDFSGDEDCYWKIVFDGKGEWTEEGGTIMYAFDAYKEFLKEYGKYMSKEEKKKLDKFVKECKMVRKI